jgi:hypothetical protein
MANKKEFYNIDYRPDWQQLDNSSITWQLSP